MSNELPEPSLPVLVDRALECADVVRRALVGKPFVPFVLPSRFAETFEMEADGRVHLGLGDNPKKVEGILLECRTSMREIEQRGGPVQTLNKIFADSGVLPAIQTGNIGYTPLAFRRAGPREPQR